MLAFFGMKQAPFTREIAPDQLFHSSSHKEAMARLEYAVQERQTCMLTGDAGMGKTTMVRAFAKQLDPARTHYEYMCDSALTPKLFYREVLGEVRHERGITSDCAEKTIPDMLAGYV